MKPRNCSLGAFLLSTGFVAAWLGIWSERAGRQKTIVNDLKTFQVYVWYDERPSSADAVSNGFFPPDFPIWHDYFHSVHTIFIRSDQLNSILPLLGQLPKLRQVYLKWGIPESDFLEVKQALDGVEVDRFVLPML